MLLVAISVVPAFALVTYSSLVHQSRAVERIEAEVLRLARLAAREQAQLIQVAAQLATALAASSAIREVDPERCGRLVADFLARSPGYRNLGAARPDGRVFCSALPAPASAPLHLGDRAYFQEALATRTAVVSEVVPGRITGQPVIVVAAPALSAGGDVRAVAFVTLGLAWIAESARHFELGAGSRFTAFDAAGRILAESPAPGASAGDPDPAWEVARQARLRGEGTVTAPGIDGAESVWGFAPVHGNGEGRLFVAVGVPSAAVLADARRTLLASIAALTAVAALAFLAAWVGGEIFVHRRVDALVATTRRLAGGDLRARTGLPRAGGELGTLARAFDTMAESLERREAALHEAEAGRSAAEQALRESQELLVLALDGLSNYAIFTADDRGRIASWPRGATGVTGYARDEVLDRDLGVLFPAGGRVRGPDVERLLARARRDGRAEHEGWVARRDGALIWADVVVASLWTEQTLRGFAVVVHDVTERREAAEALQHLSRRLMDLQEAERRSLARELHDQIGQSLTALKINLQLLRRDLAEERRATLLADTASIAQRLLERVRSISLDLRPSMLDDLGLVPAVRWYCERQAARAGFPITLTTSDCDGPFASEVETACFRIVQEAVNNAVKHGQPRHIAVELTRVGGEIDIAVRDDGSGFDLPAARSAASRGGSIGILGMEERVALLGGRFHVETKPRQGTQVHARLPLSPRPSVFDRPPRPPGAA
jgi:PAS domain S-box-containing protein